MDKLRNTLVIGKNSFIGSNFFLYSNSVDIISHSEVDYVNFDHYKTVLNCSIVPDYKITRYKEKNDIDLYIANKSSKSNCHYIMLSTRKVYGKSDQLKEYSENSHTNPFDFYSENKLITEQKIKNENENYTILRGSNVFGQEFDRKSFMGFCLTQLKNDDKIVFNINGNVKRDFISIGEFSKVLKKVCFLRKKGIYNLSSGFGLSISEIPKLLILGKKSGSFVDGKEISDQFILRNDLLCKEFEIDVRKDYTQEIFDLGRTLCKI